MQVLTPISWNKPPVWGAEMMPRISLQIWNCVGFSLQPHYHIFLSNFMAISLQYHEGQT